MWTTVDVKLIPILRREAPVVGVCFIACTHRHFCYPLAFWLFPLMLLALSSPLLLFGNISCEAAELHPTLEAQFILLLCLVGCSDGAGWTSGWGLPHGEEVLDFHSKAKWDPGIVGWSRFWFKLCWQTGRPE